MWLFFNDSFLSIVHKPGDGDWLTVRGRVPGDIESVFPGVEVVADAGTDYRFRARVPRDKVGRAVTERISALDYANFKNSVRDPHRHDAYAGVWQEMLIGRRSVEAIPDGTE